MLPSSDKKKKKSHAILPNKEISKGSNFKYA